MEELRGFNGRDVNVMYHLWSKLLNYTQWKIENCLLLIVFKFHWNL